MLEEDVEEVWSRTTICRLGRARNAASAALRERKSHCWGPQRQLIRGLRMEAVK
jgi:hypothetical protein